MFEYARASQDFWQKVGGMMDATRKQKKSDLSNNAGETILIFQLPADKFCNENQQNRSQNVCKSSGLN